VISGLTSSGLRAVASLPSGYSAATVNPLQELLRDPYRKRTYLLEAGPRNATTQAIQDVRLSNDGWASTPTDSPASTIYSGRLVTPYNAQVSVLRDGLPGGSGIPTFGSLNIGNPSARSSSGAISHEQDELADLIWTGYDLKILVGAPTFSRAEFGTIFSGTSEGIRRSLDGLELPLRGYEHLLNKPVQSTLYSGMGACVRGDGVDDYASGTVSCPAGAMTLELRVRPRTSASTQKYLARWGGTGAAGDRILRLGTGGPNRVVTVVRNDAAAVFSVEYTGAIPVNKWTDVGLVLDTADGKLNLYINAVLVGTPATISGTFATTVTDFELLRQNVSAGFADVDIDEIRVWSTPRTAAQLAGNRGRQLVGTETGLVHYWKADEDTGTTLANSVAAGPSLTLSGATWVPSLEGGAELTGKPKPKGRGQVRDFEPVFVGDATYLIYQFSDRSSHALNVAKDMGLALTPAGDVADLTTTTVSAGEYKTDLSRSLIRLGAKPTGKVTVSFQGDNTGSGYVYTAADIVRRMLVDDFGFVDPDDLDVGAFVRANAANSAVCGYITRLEVENGNEIITKLLDSVWAWWTFTRPGLFTLGVVRDPADLAAIATLTANHVMQDGIEEDTSPEPTASLRLGYQRVWSPQNPTELATSLASEEIARLGEPYQHAPSGDPAVLDGSPEAEESTFPTCFDTFSDAKAEADRRQAILGLRRSILRVSLVNGLHTYNIGDVIRIDLDRYYINHNFMVVGWIEDVPDNVQLLLWGRNVSMDRPLLAESGEPLLTEAGEELWMEAA
jgi:hypothetical protein